MSVRYDNVAWRSYGAIAVVLTFIFMLAGCASAAKPDVQAAAQGFQTAVREDHIEAACGMLSEEARSSLEATSARSCSEALSALKLPTDQPGTIEVWGDNAQARLPEGALFLAQFPSGWKITGAGCQPQSGKPYSCAVRA